MRGLHGIGRGRVDPGGPYPYRDRGYLIHCRPIHFLPRVDPCLFPAVAVAAVVVAVVALVDAVAAEEAEQKRPWSFSD